MVLDISSRELFKQRPTIHFEPEFIKCPTCGSRLNVLKTCKKTVVTLDIGEFLAVEKVLECPKDGTIYRSEQLPCLAPHRCRFGFDVMVYVGKALFIHSRSDQEIIKELAKKNIVISDRQIGNLGRKFIIYLAIAQKESREKLRDLMAMGGGYILHLDGTCEKDSPHLFTCIDGISEIVLKNIKLPSEKKELLIPFLKKLKKEYGNPIALVHDMGKGILAAVEEVFPGVLDFICHFHFLRDLGKDLLEDEYSRIRNALKKSKIRTLLRQRAKVFEKAIRQNIGVVKDLRESIDNGRIETSCFFQFPSASTYALIYWAFNTSEQLKGYGFPFDRSHLVFYQRLKLIHSVLEQMMNKSDRFESKAIKPFYRIWKLLNDVCNDEDLNKSVKLFEEKIVVFDKLRDALSIALPENKKGLNDDGGENDIKTIEEKVKEFKHWIIKDKYFSKQKCYKDMIKQIDKYWQKLFSDPILVNTPGGEIFIQPQRTNNILERFFRDFKRKSRKKSGNSSLSKTLKTMMADTPLIKNLENDEYLKAILNGCSTLEERFAKIDHKKVLKILRDEQQHNERISPMMIKIIKIRNLPMDLTKLFVS